MEVSSYNCSVDIHPSARKHGVGDNDIRHAAANAMTFDDQDNDTVLYLGAARDGQLLEIVTVMRDDGTELAIHAMRMRRGYRRLLPGGS
jgi:hypothetical protein